MNNFPDEEELLIKANKLILDGDIFVNYPIVQGNCVVKAPTDIWYSVQCGGAICDQEYIEGYLLTLMLKDTKIFAQALEEFEDCGRGCALTNYDVEYDENYNTEYAQDIDLFLIDHVNGKEKHDYNFKFDYSRLKELKEGWWPVFIQFSLNSDSQKSRGYLHFGNCD